MIRIKVFTNFCDSSIAVKNCKDVFLAGESCYKDKFMFVSDDSFTHAIILNTAMPFLNIPKENVLGLCYEPIPFLGLSQQFIDYAKKHIGTYLWGGWDGLTLESPFVKHYSYMWFSQERKNYFNNIIPSKKGKIAIWCSNKKNAPGHIYRHELIEEILKTDLNIDIWGNGCGYYNHLNDKRIKGEFNNDDPYRNYEYCISIENYITDDYISEKFTSCIACNTVPIYLGARNVERYFGDTCCIRLTSDKKSDMEIIRNVSPIDLTLARKNLFEGNSDLSTFLVKHWKL
jgi:hypothetical protein